MDVIMRRSELSVPPLREILRESSTYLIRHPLNQPCRVNRICWWLRCCMHLSPSRETWPKVPSYGLNHSIHKMADDAPPQDLSPVPPLTTTITERSRRNSRCIPRTLKPDNHLRSPGMPCAIRHFVKNNVQSLANVGSRDGGWRTLHRHN